MSCPTYLESPNPRHSSCCRCGAPKNAHPHPLTSQRVRERNLLTEQDITRHAAHGVADPSSLIRHAEARARSLSGEYVNRPELVQQGRDRLLDGREELADFRNHVVWWLEEHVEDDRQRRHVLAALRHVVLAYTLLED